MLKICTADDVKEETKNCDQNAIGKEIVDI